MKKLKSPMLLVDGLIIVKGRVLMERRNHYPFVGHWVLPGGHVECGETVEQTIVREIKEELGVPVTIEKIFGVYSDPKRDPRYPTATIVFLLKKGRGKIKIDRESSEFRFFPLENLPKKIGFDHRKIINDFIKIEAKELR